MCSGSLVGSRPTTEWFDRLRSGLGTAVASLAAAGSYHGRTRGAAEAVSSADKMTEVLNRLDAYGCKSGITEHHELGLDRWRLSSRRERGAGQRLRVRARTRRHPGTAERTRAPRRWTR